MVYKLVNTLTAVYFYDGIKFKHNFTAVYFYDDILFFFKIVQKSEPSFTAVNFSCL